MTTIRIRVTAFLAVLLPAIVFAARDNAYLGWINSPEAYFATAEEREAWNKVFSKKDADDFIERYWRTRGSRFRSEVRTRIELADQKFSLATIPGAETAKGRVWIILGSPNREQLVRSDTLEVGLPGQFQNNAMERGAIQSTRWFYQKNRLPSELGVPELTVSFQTDTSRGYQVIENPGLVEPFLKRAAALFSERGALAPATREVHSEPVPAAPGDRVGDLLWKISPDLAGSIFTGESLIAADGSPFYAVSFFVPRGATALQSWQNVLLVALVRDAAGNQVASVREAVPLVQYGPNTDRHVDRSFVLPAGKYHGFFALFSPEGSTLLTSTRSDFEVYGRDVRRMTKLLLTSSVADINKQGLFDPFTFVGVRYPVKGDRVFRRSDRITLYAIVANPASEAGSSLMMKMRFIKDGNPFAATSFEPTNPVQTSPVTYLIGNQFDANTFEPGHYTLHVETLDMKAQQTFTESTEFTVTP
jgi:GWxTD domain-containing protein